MKQTMSFLIAIMLAAGTISLGCYSMTHLTGAGTPGANEVWMVNMAFTPASITVAVNTTVTWTNKDGMPHTVMSNDNTFYSGSIDNGGTYTHTFHSAGTYSYHCSLHPNMPGTVIVQ